MGNKLKIIGLAASAIILAIVVRSCRADIREHQMGLRDIEALKNDRDSLEIVADEIMSDIMRQETMAPTITPAETVYVQRRSKPIRMSEPAMMSEPLMVLEMNRMEERVGDLLILDRIDTMYIVDTVYKTYIKIDTIVYDKDDIRKLKLKKNR